MKRFEIWFVTGSQHLYGPETLAQVERHAGTVARALADSPHIPVSIVLKPAVTTPDSIYETLTQANTAANCIGLIFWMHTFSPAKMWIRGLKALSKPFLHLHTQFNRELPWASIDMDFMNLNQSAHGDREFGYICTRMGLRRKVVVGFWNDEQVQREIGAWSRAAAGWHESQRIKVARFGDNMRQVAVTEGDKVEAEIALGYSVNGFGIGDLAHRVNAVTDVDARRLVDEYRASYDMQSGIAEGPLLEAARIELGLRAFLTGGGFSAFTDTFEDLHGITQLPGIAAQRLMADGYGFGPEGDWKSAALVRTMKVMSEGLEGGTSLMEDYTYHFGDGGQVLGAHMLEICPSIANGKPRCEVHPLSIGGKADPVRLVFDARTGPAINVSIVDMGDHMRMLVNPVDVISPPEAMPKLPVARVLWEPEPNFKTAATQWILAGGSHHTSFSQALTVEHMQDFATIAGLEFVLIN